MQAIIQTEERYASCELVLCSR